MIEMSHAVGDLTGVRFFTAGSKALQGRGDLCVWEPPGPARPGAPLFILLHGIFGSHWAWVMNGRAHEAAGKMVRREEMPPAVLAMPSDGLIGTGSAYVPQTHANPESWVVDEVPAVLRRMSKWVNRDSPVFIAGLSMGGYGAMRLGAKYPGRFRGMASMSSPTNVKVLADFSPHFNVPLPVEDEEYSLLHWVTTNRDGLPPLRIDCGVDDQLIGLNRKLHAQLDSAEVPHVYEELEGGHDWQYWKRNIGRTFGFFADVLARTGQP